MGRLIMILSLLVLSATTVTPLSMMAAELKTITLSVDKMTCSLCPVTVKRALKKLDGVSDVSAKYEGDGVGWAKVTFDPSLVDVDEMTFTTEMAGYPSHLKE